MEQILIDDVSDSTEPTDVAHRPWQVNSPLDLRRLRQMGNRVVVTQQDFIAFRNPGYFTTYDEWDRYCQCTRQSLTGAERVVFFSHHAACEAEKEGLVEPERSRVVYIGVDHRLSRREVEPRRPRTDVELDGRQFILCLGVDFIHKNRLFALQVMEQLQGRHGWDGRLVLAGHRASPGSSASTDDAFLRKHPGVAAATAVTGGVSEEEKRWLFEHAALVISPTTYEGFGLIPFEAADAGVPCLFAPQASLAEVLPRELALIEPWDAELTSDRAMKLLSDPAERARLVDSVRSAAGRYRWDRTAEEVLEVYREAAQAPGLDVSQHPFGAPRAGHQGRIGGSIHARAFSKTVGWWRGHGLVRGTWLGSRALARKVAQRAGVGSPRQPVDS